MLYSLDNVRRSPGVREDSERNWYDEGQIQVPEAR